MTWKAYLIIIFSGILIIIIIGAGIVMYAPQPLKFANMGKAAPFTLVDQNNNTVTLNNYTGKVLMVDFIYTHCPNPNGTYGECSTETLKMNTLLGDMIQMGYTANDFHLLSVSIDWRFDNASTMLAYGKDRGERQFQYWSFLSGSKNQVENITQGYNILAEYNLTLLLGKNPSANNTIEYMDHSVMAYLIDKNGNIMILEKGGHLLYPISGTTWLAKDVAKQMSALIKK